MESTQTESTAKAMARHAAQAEALLKALANAQRLKVLCHLTQGEESVGELTDKLGLSQSALSQHLARMKAAGLLASRKSGKQVYYRIASMEAQAVLTTLYLIYCHK